MRKISDFPEFCLSEDVQYLIVNSRRFSKFKCEFSLMFSLELQFLKGSFANRRLLEEIEEVNFEEKLTS